MLKKRFWKRITALVTAVVLLTATLAGCGTQSSSKGDDLNIIVWSGTWSEQMFKDYEKETGTHVNVTYIDNTDTLMSKLIQGNADYDLIDLESAYVQPFIKNDLLAKVDHKKITNEKYIISDFNKGAPGDEKMQYTVADMAPGYTTVVYNKETCPVKITSFKDLANPALKGQVAMVNSTISLYGEALTALGYKPNSTNKKEIKEANDLLRSIKGNVKAFVGESAVSQLENGECSVAFCWDYPTLCNDSKANWDKFECVPLTEGYERFQQYWAIPTSSKKKAEAQKLINFILSPKELAKTYKEYGGTPLEERSAMEKYLGADYYNNPSISLAEQMESKSWCVPVNDKQINIMDTYYTDLMGDKAKSSN